MAYGKIINITYDPATSTSEGELEDLTTKLRLPFSGEPGLIDVDRQDVVNYTNQRGQAITLSPNLAVRLHLYNQYSQELKDAVDGMLKAMAGDPVKGDIISRKM